MLNRFVLLCVAVFAVSVSAQKPPPAKDAGVAAPVKPTAAMTFSEGVATPESVLYDADADTYLFGNINGSPLGKDNNGFITEISPDGKVVAAKLIEGGQKGVTLNAPKGLALFNGVLYVADIDTVRMFDRKSGAPAGEVKVPGATFLNDLFATADGKVYLTDSGMKAGKGGFEGTGTDGVYVIEPGKKPKLKTLLKSKDLKRPNGIVVSADRVYVAPFGGDEITVLDLNGKKKGEPIKLGKARLDGLVLMGDRLFVSSWESQSVWAGKPGEAFVEVLVGLNAPADIGFDSKRNRVLVPRFMDNLVEAWDVK